MPLTKKFRPFGVRQIRWTPHGGSDGVTEGTAQILDGAQTATVDVQVDEVTVSGDDQVLETGETNQRGTVSMTTAGLSQAALASMKGATLVASGTTPNQIEKVDVLASSKAPYGKLEIRCVINDGLSDIVYTLHRCRFPGGPSAGGNTGAYTSVSYTGTAIPHPVSGKLITYEARETAVAWT